MKIFETREVPFFRNISAQIALVLATALILWATGAPLFLNHVKAASLSNQSDTLSNSNNSSLSKHTVVYTNATSTIAGQTIVIGLDPVGSAFTEAFSGATSSDIFLLDNGTAITYAPGNVCGTNDFTAQGNYNNGTNENLTLTLCPSTSIPAGHTITVVVGSTTRLWTNPAATTSYRITIGGTQDNSGETRVAILPNVVLTAAINTSFTFTVTGLATTTGIGGNATTTASSTATTLPFGTLASSTGSVILGQQLNVTTNARNGFAVTVQENQPPTSGAGAIINLFSNGATTSTPILWTAPTAILDQYNTYSHFGVTSDDTDENSTGVNEFGGGTKWAGNIDQPRVVFSHTGPADGTTQNKGTAKVAFRIQITDLQPAGNDYTNTLTYVATPTF